MRKKVTIFALVFFMMGGLLSSYVQADNTEYGFDAHRYMRYLNDVYPDRVQNTDQVREAGVWIKELLQAYGYTVQEHAYDAFGMKIVNYVVEKPGNSEKTVYVGAHYDGVAGASKGADDNASGVGVVLELAKRFYNTPTNVTIKFCFWDAEEIDYACAGSYLYVERMTPQEKANCLTYINLDTVGAGDNMYVYGGYYDADGLLQDTWGLNMADDVAARLGAPLLHMPESVTYYHAPTRATGSDHQSFKNAGMSYLYFEANAWQYPDGSINEEHPWMLTSTSAAFKANKGEIMHTANDDMDVIENALPGTIQRNLSNVSKIVSQMLREFTVNSKTHYSVTVPETPSEESTQQTEPTTGEPTTEEPTTEEPTTEEPTTEEPTTEETSTQEPTTEESSTKESTTTSETQKQEPSEPVEPNTPSGNNVFWIAGGIAMLVVAIFIIARALITK